MNRREFLRAAAAAAAAQIARPTAAAAAPALERKIRIGQIGTWHSHAAGKMEAIRKLPQLFEIVGIAEPNAALRAAALNRPAYAGLPWLTEDELLAKADLDAVLVETDIPEFVPTALRCARAGKHIHLEKPAGPSLPEFRALIQLCRDHKLTLQMGYMFRYNPGFELCFRAAREGWLGQIYEIHGVIGKVYTPEARQTDKRFGGGVMFELGCHLIDPTVLILGQPASVHGHLQRTGSDNLADNALAVLEYPSATATIRSAAIDFDGFARRQFAVHGTQGSAVLRPLEPPSLILNLAQPRGGFAAGAHAVALPPSTGRYDAQMEDFARTIRGERPALVAPAHDLAVHETLLRACAMPLT